MNIAFQRRGRRKNWVTPWEEKEHGHSRGGGEGRTGSLHGRRRNTGIPEEEEKEEQGQWGVGKGTGLVQKRRNRGNPEKEGKRVIIGERGGTGAVQRRRGNRVCLAKRRNMGLVPRRRGNKENDEEQGSQEREDEQC
jgi:hypothetical protein